MKDELYVCECGCDQFKIETFMKVKVKKYGLGKQADVAFLRKRLRCPNCKKKVWLDRLMDKVKA